MESIAVSFLYQIFVPSFFDADGDGFGDLKGVEARIPYLEKLGVECVVMSGIFETTDPESDHAITDHKKLNPRIGTSEDMAALIDALHQREIKVALTLPLYATSTSHVWFEKAARAQNDYNLYRDYYFWAKGTGANGKKAPKSAEKEVKKRYTYHSQAKLWYECTEDGAPILNMNNPRVRREFTNAIEYWRSIGIDAICLSAHGAEALEGQTERRGYIALLRDIAEKVESAPAIYIESFPIFTDEEYTPLLSDGSIVCAPPRDILAYTDAALKTKFSLTGFLSDYTAAAALPTATGRLLAFEDRNHKRLISKVADISEHDLLSAAGRSIATFLFTSPGIPSLYQGQELGMTDMKGDKKSIFAVSSKSNDSHGKDHLPFQWDNVRNAGFTAAPYSWKAIHENFTYVNAQSEAKDPKSVLNHYARMIAIRKGSYTLKSGAFHSYYGADKNVIAFTRESEEETLFVVCSFAQGNLNYPIPSALLTQGFTCVLSTYDVVSPAMHASIGLRPFEARIYRKTTEKDIKLLH